MVCRTTLLCFFLYCSAFRVIVDAQDGDPDADPAPAPPKELESCNGIFVSYNLISRTKEYPHIKNASAQPWGFKAMATVVNAGMTELKNWKIFIGFHYQEILVSASNAVLVGGDSFPAQVGDDGAYLAGSPQTDLKTSIQTAGDLEKIQTQIELSGTQFGIKPPGYPMPKTVKLVNDGFRCPGSIRREKTMYVCCVKDPKFKGKNLTETKHSRRQKGDLLFSYDVLQAYDNNYLAQVTIENRNPLGRLDQWNLTWEWMRGEFIYTMRGAYTRIKSYTGCIYGAAGQYYQSLEFSKVMNCDKIPIIADLPEERALDKDIGNLPGCCRNGSILPSTMNDTKSVSIFQLQVFKVPPDMNKTALFPPQNWKIVGAYNPHYKCGQPLRVEDAIFPDPTGLDAISLAIASWQVVCNITKPKKRAARCCVSYSAYYNESVIPCNTCACGCSDSAKCNKDAPAMFLPADALLAPFDNRTLKATHWARIKHRSIPRPLPCGDNCGVSINWHVVSNYRGGWSARLTLFNWEERFFKDWFVAVQFKKTGRGFEQAYSFNGTLLKGLNHTVFLQGLPGLNYLMGQVNDTLSGKQQSVLSFTKSGIRNINIVKGDGFPKRLLFNGEECALPTQLLEADEGSGNSYTANLYVHIIFITVLVLVIC